MLSTLQYKSVISINVFIIFIALIINPDHGKSQYTVALLHDLFTWYKIRHSEIPAGKI